MSEAKNITISNTNSVDVSVTLATDSKSVAITDGSNVSLSIDSEAGNTIVATQQSPTLSLSVTASEALDVQTKQKMSVSVINPNKYVYTEGSTWGDIAGTITNQTDLVNYITSRLSSDTINDAADVLQVLEDAGLTFEESSIDAKIPFSIFGTDNNGNPIVIPNTTTPLGYTLPKPNAELLSGVPYFMVTRSDGTNINLSWLNLGFALGDDDEYILDGGQYGS
jgi:hypothetical protein